jgi:subtilisin family serine protease
MRPKSKLLLLHLLLLFALFIPLPAAAQPISAQEGRAKMQNYLRQLAQHEPTERVALIVQKQTTDDGVEQFVERNGGTITRSLALINAFAAEVPASLLPRLAELSGVRQVSINAPVVNQNSALPGSVSAQDDFAAVAYNGSDGTFAWQNDWAEIGEADGADQGDVGVTAFWGGALQGLRLQGAAKGIWRGIDLSQATATQLQMSYRRKDFTEADYIALEVTTDQISWLEVARWNGPMTDGELLSATVDLTSYQTAQTAIRFVTSANLTTGARFYLDSVRIDFIPTWQASSFTNQLYLPLAANSDGTPVLREGEAATFDKAAALAQPNDGRSNQCWNCINLGVLQNNYVKAINADDLWNVAPYVRGWGVTVAVVDSGISNHPDFNDYWGKSRIVQRVSFVPSAPSPDDFYGHGTHIAGAIAGLGVASAGRYLGVAPEAKLIDVKVMDDWGYGNTADVIAGLQWVFDNRALYNSQFADLQSGKKDSKLRGC